MLEDVQIGLGVTGSIAAVRTVELIHEFRRQGADVRVVMTQAAESIIDPWALEFASDNPVITEITGSVEHIDMFGQNGWADIFVIAPSTANTIAKIASSIDDTPVTTCATTAIGSNIPLVIAPAMHEPMFEHPGVLDAIDTLEDWNISFTDPRIEEGKAKIATNEAIVLDVARKIDPSPLSGKHIVITAGATKEPIDPVRILTNRASGKTGHALAKACYVYGADVTLIHEGKSVPYADGVSYSTTNDLQEAIFDNIQDADCFISTAAVGDFTVDTRAEKISSGEEITLTLQPTEKLLDSVRERYPDLPIVGFKLESTNSDSEMIQEARNLLERVDLSFVVANNERVMGENTSRVLVVRDNSIREYQGSKGEIGRYIADEIVKIFE
ncbi:MAG: bifunctional phosphopantothenoylcysteine decarboxylase/phosphopantothenate--cysteine ligase CoaBC [Halobacteriaceae archaeon]